MSHCIVLARSRLESGYHLEICKACLPYEVPHSPDSKIPGIAGDLGEDVVLEHHDFFRNLLHCRIAFLIRVSSLVVAAYPTSYPRCCLPEREIDRVCLNDLAHIPQVSRLESLSPPGLRGRNGRVLHRLVLEGDCRHALVAFHEERGAAVLAHYNVLALW